MQNKKNSKKKFPSNKHTNLVRIEDIVDEIIQKNKEKLRQLNTQEINIEEFSLKNKKQDALYYIKKKSNKKEKNNNLKLKNKKLNSKSKKVIDNKKYNKTENSTKKENKNTISEDKKFNEPSEKNITIDNKIKSDKTEKLLLDFKDINQNLLPLKSTENEQIN
ncbi:hypothetical protein AYK20_05420 [Thermoplasmatales archaeon SG8-52-1]|nr:MAG: hypothetical protein AYK20_05420 [Thermoplasmatales archaeon SG8-52-1]